MKILVLCTGNSCRSQMAEGFLRNIDNNIEVFSAGTMPEEEVNKYAVIVMQEIGIDISGGTADNINKYLDKSFDYVISVCDNAKESCPVFSGKVDQRLHIGFEDPADAIGSDDKKLYFYRKIRDEIKIKMLEFYNRI